MSLLMAQSTKVRDVEGEIWIGEEWEQDDIGFEKPHSMVELRCEEFEYGVVDDGLSNGRRQRTHHDSMFLKYPRPFHASQKTCSPVSSSKTLVWGLLPKAYKWIEHFPCPITTAKSLQNRRLEYRKPVQHSSPNLRILRFGFRHPIYPPHEPEMDELGLTRETYNNIISKIEETREAFNGDTQGRVSHLLSSCNKVRRRNRDDALRKLVEYIRSLNASQRKVVWTIELVSGVYEQGFWKDKKEWEITAWNGKDPLELLIQLENSGIIEKKLDIQSEG